VLSRPRASGAVQVRYTCARLASRLPDPRATRTPTTMAKITSGFRSSSPQERPANLQPCQLEPHCCDSALPAPAAVITSEQCKERGADAWIGECTARLGGVALDPSLLVCHWLLSAVYGQRRRRDAPCVPPLFLPMIGHLPDSPDPAPKESGPADRPLVCRSAGSSGSPCSWLVSSAPADRHRPWIRQGGMPAAWRIGRRPTGRRRPRPDRRRRLPVQIRQLVAQPRGAGAVPASALVNILA
jgi:hypothetical protein